jgi:hypothetical protein
VITKQRSRKVGYNWNDLRQEERDKVTKTNILRPERLRTKKLDHIWGCIDCRWRGLQKESKRDITGSFVVYVCPKCGGQIESKGNRPDDKEIKKALSEYCDLMNIIRPYYTTVVEDPNTGRVLQKSDPLSPPLKITLDDVIYADYVISESTIKGTRVTKGMKLMGVIFQIKNPERNGGTKFWKFV